MDFSNKILNSIVKHASNSFEYGKLDCAIFAGKVAKDIHNINIVDKFINKYTKAEGAIEYLNNNNYANLVEAVTSELDKEAVSTSELKNGDLVAIRSKYKEETLRYALGIVYKNYGFFIREKGNTIGKVHLDKCECGWILNG